MTTLSRQPISTQSLRDLIAQEIPDLIAIRRDLHAHPEIGYEEHRTSQVVQRELKKTGIDFVANLAGGTGVMAHLGTGDGKKPQVRSQESEFGDGRAIGLRADMDALPIEETSGLP